MKRVYYFVLMIIAFVNIYSIDYIFDESSKYFSINKTDTGYNIKINKLEINEDNGFTNISINDYNYTNKIGYPKIPAIRFFIQGNYNTNNIKIEFLNPTEFNLKSSVIIPFQNSVSKQINQRDFIINKNFYNSDSIYPNKDYNIEFIGYSGNQKKYLIEIYPIKYNIANNKVFVNTDINVYIDNIWETKNENYDLPSKYLFVVDSIDLNYINSLIELKKQQGFTVEILLLDTIGSTNTDIQSAIQNVYNSSLIPLQFVLLIGDIDKIPHFIGTETDNPPTDLYYSLKDTLDYFPDYFVGRLPVSDTSDLINIVDKTVLIEKGLWSIDDNWVNRAYLMASDDPSFHLLAEGTQNYSAERLRELYMVVDSFYDYYLTGTPISDALNNGRSIAIYTGHGSEVSWGGPSFSQSDISSLLNNEMFPIVVSFACLTGNYAYLSDCFGETWVKSQDIGAAMYMGSSVYSYWDEDDIMGRALMDAIVDSDYTVYAKMMNYAKYAVYSAYSGGGLSKRYFEMYNILGDPSIDLFTKIDGDLIINCIDTFGINMTKLDIYITDDANMQINNANVSCFIDDTFVSSGFTDNTGFVSFNINPLVSDIITIYVYKHNYKPVNKNISVQNSAYLPYINALIFNDTIYSMNAANYEFSAADTGNIQLQIINYGTQAICSLYYSINAVNDYIVMDSQYIFVIDSLYPGDTLLTAPIYAYVKYNIENNMNEILNINLATSTDTIIQKIINTIQAPDVNYVNLIYADSNVNIVTSGDSLDVSMSFVNLSEFYDRNINIKLSSLSSFLTFSKDSFNFDSITTDTCFTDTFYMRIDSALIGFSYLNFMIILEDEIGIIDSFFDSIPVNKFDYLVLDYDGNNNSAPIIDSLLNDLGYYGEYRTSIQVEELINYNNIFVCLGVYPSNTVLSAGDAFAIALDSMLNEGNYNLYIEGGECWYWDISNGGYNYNTSFEINPIGDGNSSLLTNTFLGLQYSIATDLSYQYSGDNQYLDIISATGNGRNFFINDASYYSVSNIGINYRTVGMSFELGGLDEGTSIKRQILERIMQFFNGDISGIDKNEINNEYDFKLLSVYPNPFKNNITVKYQVPTNSKIDIKIYDITGREVYSSIKSYRAGGIKIFNWNGNDLRNNNVSAGIYFIKIRNENKIISKKLIMIK